MNPLLVGMCALAGAAAGPGAAATSRVLHERFPRTDEVAAAYHRPDGRAALSAVSIGLLFAIGAATWGWSWLLPPFLFLFLVLVVMAVVDLEHELIPNRLVFPSTAVAAGAILVASLLDGSPKALGPAVLGAVGFYLGLFIAHVISPAGMGFGDVKLALLLGLYLGWSAQGYLDALYLDLLALLVGSLLGSLVGVVLLVRRGRGAHYPFGPWLGLGTVVVVLGAEVLRSA